MDTLTQITLGAACGEAVLGRKIGNRAMIWGAFGGLLPDLDVAAHLFTNEINALAFHRGFMHSLLFALLAAGGLSWLVRWLYKSGHYKRRWYKQLVFSFLVFLLLVIAGGLSYVSFSPENGINVPVSLIVAAGVIVAVRLVWKKYYLAEWAPATAGRKEWFWLFWWSVFTHILLDCFTSYGTQIFQPFSNYPVAFSSIAVIDPLYTVPFIICILIAALLRKEDPRRRIVNWLGIGISSAYLLLTVFHRSQADQLFRHALEEQVIPASRYTISPTMFNNYLWQGVAEGDTAYYHAMFSLLGEPPFIPAFNVLPKNNDLLAPYAQDEVVRVLKWFTWGYYNVLKLNEHQYQLNVVRYGSAGDDFQTRDDFAFRFIIEEQNGRLKAYQKRAYHSITWAGLKKQFARMRGEE